MKIEAGQTPDGLPRVAWQEPTLSMGHGFKMQFYIVAGFTGLLALLITSALANNPKNTFGDNLAFFLVVWCILFFMGFIKALSPRRFPKMVNRKCHIEKRNDGLYFCSDFDGKGDARRNDPQKWELRAELLSSFMLGTETEWFHSDAAVKPVDDQFVIFAVNQHGRRVLVSCNCMNRNDNADLHAVLREQFSPYDVLHGR